MEEKIMNDNNERELNNAAEQTVDESVSEDSSSAVAQEDEVNRLRAEIEELKDKYLRQVAEFDNFRKRTAKERIELIQTAGKDVITSLLDVLDDCDRAEKQLEVSDDVSVTRQGVALVFSKLRSILYAKGLKPMESIGSEFDADQHEAITSVPAGDKMKGKVVDEVQKGYYLNDKIIRFAKVVVGQ
jgi:molecular chaperone GrpE